MNRHLTAVLAVCLLAVIVTAAGASYVSELLFIGEGSYNHDANPNDIMGYGDFGTALVDFDLSLRTPNEACNWYLRTDVAITFADRLPGRGAPHVIRMDDTGIWADQHVVEWTDLGYSWNPEHGVHLGYGAPTGTRSYDPYNIIGDYAWDIDGGGDDLTASILPSSSPDYAYRLTAEQRRSMTWLSTMPLGTMAAAWMSPFVGGLPLDGLELGINTIAPYFEMWDGHSYDVTYSGKILLTADAACPVPEPSSILLLGTGLMAAGSLGLRRRKRGD